MNSKTVVTIILIVWLALVSCAGFYVVAAHQAALEAQFNKEVAVRQAEFRLKLILECQKLSATTTNSGWTYKSCIKELKVAEPETKVL